MARRETRCHVRNGAGGGRWPYRPDVTQKGPVRSAGRACRLNRRLSAGLPEALRAILLPARVLRLVAAAPRNRGTHGDSERALITAEMLPLNLAPPVPHFSG